MNFSKVTEQLISEYLVADMKAKFDNTQSGKQVYSTTYSSLYTKSYVPWITTAREKYWQ